MGRQALGRGLEALIPLAKGEPGIVEIPLVEIRPGPFQPRKRFDDKKLDELAASIRAQGILSPVIVRQIPGGYELVAGGGGRRAAGGGGGLPPPGRGVWTDPGGDGRTGWKGSGLCREHTPSTQASPPDSRGSDRRGHVCRARPGSARSRGSGSSAQSARGGDPARPLGPGDGAVGQAAQERTGGSGSDHPGG